MSIRTSIYDFFAYTIPGGLVLFAVLGGIEMFGLTDLWTKYYRSNFSELLTIVVCSYIVGHLTNPLNSKWVKLFESRGIPKVAFDEFIAKHPTIETDINPNDWEIWFASIRRESMELTHEVDRQKATSILMRGISFFLALSCLILFLGVFSGKLVWWYSILAIITALFSFIAVKESMKFNKWFYFLIFELVVSRKEPYVFTKPDQSKEKPQ